MQHLHQQVCFQSDIYLSDPPGKLLMSLYINYIYAQDINVLYSA